MGNSHNVGFTPSGEPGDNCCTVTLLMEDAGTASTASITGKHFFAHGDTLGQCCAAFVEARITELEGKSSGNKTPRGCLCSGRTDGKADGEAPAYTSTVEGKLTLLEHLKKFRPEWAFGLPGDERDIEPSSTDPHREVSLAWVVKSLSHRLNRFQPGAHALSDPTTPWPTSAAATAPHPAGNTAVWRPLVNGRLFLVAHRPSTRFIGSVEQVRVDSKAGPPRFVRQTGETLH